MDAINYTEIANTLDQIQGEVVKAGCLLLEVIEEYFERLKSAVATQDRVTIFIMAAGDAVTAGIKSEIVSDILERITSIVNDCRESMGNDPTCAVLLREPDGKEQG